MTDELHRSVMPEEALRYLVAQGGRYVDMTLGGGGHARAILEANDENELLGLDRDDEAIAIATRRLSDLTDRAHLEHAKFSAAGEAAARLGWEAVDGVLMDLGVSSMQIDRAERGFSYRQNGPLDMRMDRRQDLTAAEVLNTAAEGDLARWFRDYGDLPQARRLARAIVARRRERPWANTDEFAELCRAVLRQPRGRTSPVEGRAFQALRIVVNDEMGELERGLELAIGLLRPGGRLVVISFHSIEDRIVKNVFRDAAKDYEYRPELPPEQCLLEPRLQVLTKKPVRPGEDEVVENPRAAPARLRAAEKLATEADRDGQ